MPIYEYRCEDCGEESDLYCLYKDKPKTVPCSCGLKAEWVPSRTAVKCRQYNSHGNIVESKGFNPMRELPGMEANEGRNRLDYEAKTITVDSSRTRRHKSKEARVKDEFIAMAKVHRAKRRQQKKEQSL